MTGVRDTLGNAPEGGWVQRSTLTPLSRTRHKSRSRTMETKLTRVPHVAASLVAAFALMAGGSTPALANEGQAADGADVVSEFFEVLEYSEPDVVKAVDAFEALSATDQAEALATLQGDSPSDIFTLGEASVTTVRSRAVPSRLATTAAATYEVTSNFTVPVAALGITFGSFNLRYKYQTGSNRVLKDYSCTAWRTGTAGFWSYSVITDKWVTGGIGNCVALFTGSLVYKGSSITQNKEMGMTVNGAGIRSTWLTAV